MFQLFARRSQLLGGGVSLADHAGFASLRLGQACFLAAADFFRGLDFRLQFALLTEQNIALFLNRHNFRGRFALVFPRC